MEGLMEGLDLLLDDPDAFDGPANDRLAMLCVTSKDFNDILNEAPEYLHETVTPPCRTPIVNGENDPPPRGWVRRTGAVAGGAGV